MKYNDLDEAVIAMKKANPSVTQISVVHRIPWKQFIVANPNVVRKGRWYYYKYGNELILLKSVPVVPPTGYNTVHFEKIQTGLTDYKPNKIKIAKEGNGSVKLEWKTFEWKNKGEK